MSSNTMTPVPILNRNSSDDEILGLTTHLTRRTAQTERGERNVYWRRSIAQTYCRIGAG
jgi:hypothetical protein